METVQEVCEEKVHNAVHNIEETGHNIEKAEQNIIEEKAENKEVKKKKKKKSEVDELQISFGDFYGNDESEYKEFLSEVMSVDMMNSTPLEIMNIMYSLQKKAKELSDK